jgi:hypothetical protein
MPEKRQRGRKYKHTTNAVNITLHTMDGTNLPIYVREEVLEAVNKIAHDNMLIVNVVDS